MAPPTPRRKPSPRGGAEAAPIRIETRLFHLFGSILSRRSRALNTELDRVGLDYPRWRVLAVLNQNPGSSMLQLAEHASVDRTSLAHTVGMMVGEGLVLRTARKSDRRSVALSLSARGRTTLKQILPIVAAHNNRALVGFSAREIAALRDQLNRMLDNLK